MSNVTSALTAYVDQTSTELLVPAITKGVTASLVTVQPGIKSSAALQKYTQVVTFQDDDCAWNASGTQTWSQRTLAVDDIKIQEVICQKDLEAFWTQTLLTAGSEITEADIPAMYMQLRMEMVAFEIEKVLWQGEDGVAAGNLAFSDGFLMKIDGDGQGVTVNGNPNDILESTGIVAANVVSIFQTQFENIPEALIGNPNVTSFCGWDTFRTYIIALTNANMFHYVSDGAMDSGTITVPGLGLKIQAVAGLTGTNRIITCDPKNLYIGTDLVSDSETMRLWLADDKRNIRSDISFKIGTEVAYFEEIVDFRLYPS